MRKSLIGITAVLLAACGLLLSLAPDTLSILVVGGMVIVIALGYALNFLPSASYISGLQTGRRSIAAAQEVQATEIWVALFKLDSLFHHKQLDDLFEKYRTKVEAQRERGEILIDLEEYLNEELLALSTWQGLTLQIPGILTGLGIMGTFTGLIFGISNVGFSTVEAALESITVLLKGIDSAFYTSIAGVILSIIFNIVYRIIWNILLREVGLFLDEYHKQVVPSAEEQLRAKNSNDIKHIIELLERLPKNNGYSLSGGGRSEAQAADMANEHVMMQQIRSALKNQEFTFFLQPKVNLGNRAVVSAEALVRWNHPRLGILTPANFIPIVEKNGYIIRLDQFVWESVCMTLRRWIDDGIRPLPVSINVSKTDIMAMDIPAFFTEMLDKYRIPPRLLDIEIAKNCYIQSPGSTYEVEKELRRMGFKVVLDGFDGDFISLNMLDEIEADSLKLDIRFLDKISYQKLYEYYAQASALNIDISAEGVENAEQVTNLRRAGYTESQGFYFYKPMSIEDFEDILTGKSREL